MEKDSQEKRKVLKIETNRVEAVLGLKLDLEEDKERGLPGVVCR